METVIQVQILIDVFKEEISKLINENILLKARVQQLQNELSDKEKND